MLRRLFIVLQSLCSIPPILFFFFWFEDGYHIRDLPFPGGKPFTMFVRSLIPYGFVILGKWIIYGKFHIYKIGEGEENKLRDSSRKDDSKNSNQDFDDPPFPDGF